MNDLLEFIDIEEEKIIEFPLKKIIDLFNRYNIEYDIICRDRLEFNHIWSGLKETIIYDDNRYRYIRRFHWKKEDQVYYSVNDLISYLRSVFDMTLKAIEGIEGYNG